MNVPKGLDASFPCSKAFKLSSLLKKLRKNFQSLHTHIGGLDRQCIMPWYVNFAFSKDTTHLSKCNKILKWEEVSSGVAFIPSMVESVNEELVSQDYTMLSCPHAFNKGAITSNQAMSIKFIIRNSQRNTLAHLGIV